MAEIFRSKEVYKKLPYEYDNKHEMVAVRGVYVSGEYRPPYYNEPTIRISYINTIPATVVDYQDVSVTTGEDTFMKVKTFDFSISSPTITAYTTDSKSAGEDAFMKVLGFNFSVSTPSCDWYESKSVSSGEDTFMKVVNFSFIQNQITNITVYTKAYENSTPEHTLRLMSIDTDPATIEDFIPT